MKVVKFLHIFCGPTAKLYSNILDEKKFKVNQIFISSVFCWRHIHLDFKIERPGANPIKETLSPKKDVASLQFRLLCCYDLKGGAVNIEYGNIENGNIEFILTLKTVTSNITSNFSKHREHREEGLNCGKVVGNLCW